VAQKIAGKKPKFVKVNVDDNQSRDTTIWNQGNSHHDRFSKSGKETERTGRRHQRTSGWSRGIIEGKLSGRRRELTFSHGALVPLKGPFQIAVPKRAQDRYDKPVSQKTPHQAHLTGKDEAAAAAANVHAQPSRSIPTEQDQEPIHGQ